MYYFTKINIHCIRKKENVLNFDEKLLLLNPENYVKFLEIFPNHFEVISNSPLLSTQKMKNLLNSEKYLTSPSPAPILLTLSSNILKQEKHMMSNNVHHREDKNT